MRTRDGARDIMTVRRLFVSSLPTNGGRVALDEASGRHVRVLRLRVGDEVVLFDGDGGEAQARLEKIGEEVVCASQSVREGNRRPGRLVLMLGVPKGSKVDDCVRMATELGVDEVALVLTQRSVPRWDRSRAASKVDRLARIASEASAQCERSDLPLIHAPRSLEGWLERTPVSAWRVVFDARAHARLDSAPSSSSEVWCAVGPEGGFSTGELTAFSDAGFAVASLGPLVLRVETAVPAALSLVGDRRLAC